MGEHGNGRSGDAPDGHNWVFDDDFVAGGIREDSLRHRSQGPTRRSPRTALGNPAGPRDWTPARPGGLPRRPRGRLRWVVLLLVAATGVTGLVRFAATDDSGGPAPIAASGGPVAGATVPSGGVPDAGAVSGISPTTPVGTCLRGRSEPGAGLDVHETTCRGRHDYELVARERATGADATYPDDSYWHGPVAQRCYADVRRYTGQPRDRWPDYLTSTSFVPQRAGWATGDRVVYCLAQLGPATAGSVRHLPAARPSVITSAARTAPATPPGDTGAETITGRLFVRTQGPDVCLAVRSSRYTGPVVSAAPGLSWRAEVDSAGRPDVRGSGIALASEARRDNLRWHAGERVTLTGTFVPGYEQSCGAATEFGFTTVR